MLIDRICKQCGATFKGGPRAYYCPVCRTDRQRQTNADYRRRKRQGNIRPLGSTDVCDRCDKSYTVDGGLQRFCKECQPIHAAEYDRQTSLEFYKSNKDKINPPRKLKRRKVSNICAICEKEFEPINGSTTCSPKCKRLLQNKHAREYRARLKGKTE